MDYDDKIKKIEKRLSRIEAVLKKAGMIELGLEDLNRELFCDYIRRGKIKEWNALVTAQQKKGINTDGQKRIDFPR